MKAKDKELRISIRNVRIFENTKLIETVTIEEGDLDKMEDEELWSCSGNALRL